MTDFLDRARELAPRIAERAQSCEAARRVPSETIAEFRQAGFFEMLKPRTYGGAECDPRDFFDVVTEISRACGSSGWVLSLLGVHVWRLASFPQQAANEVWRSNGGGQSELIATGHPAQGDAEETENGYRIAGRWSFSSGVDHCGWAYLAVNLPATSDGGLAVEHMALVERAQFRVEDTWHAAGLAGTGTNTVVVEDAIVPKHRFASGFDSFLLRRPVDAASASPVYRYPTGLMTSLAVSVPAIGLAEAARDVLRDFIRSKTSSGPRNQAGNTFAHERLAETGNRILIARLLLDSTCADLKRIHEEDRAITMEERARLRMNASLIAETCTAAVTGAFQFIGGTGLRTGHPIQRIFRDAQAVLAHDLNNAQRAAENLGRVSSGLTNKLFFL